jgi:peroxiredoxin
MMTRKLPFRPLRVLAAVAGLALGLAVAGPATAAVNPGDQAPDFTLTDTEGRTHTLSEYLAAGHTVVLEWFNPDCPFIVKHHEHHRTMNQTYAEFVDQGVVWLAINSGAPGKQGHGLEHNRKARADFEMPMPVLIDESGTVGKQYGAKTTPHMFVITADGTVVYDGAIDSDRSPHELGATNHVAEALTAVFASEAVPTSRTRPYGCSVKYAD